MKGPAAAVAAAGDSWWPFHPSAGAGEYSVFPVPQSETSDWTVLPGKELKQHLSNTTGLMAHVTEIFEYDKDEGLLRWHMGVKPLVVSPLRSRLQFSPAGEN